MVFMEKSIYLSINLGKNEQLVRVTVAYSDTFPVARGCHCNQLGLYHSNQIIFTVGEVWSRKINMYLGTRITAIKSIYKWHEGWLHNSQEVQITRCFKESMLTGMMATTLQRVALFSSAILKYWAKEAKCGCRCQFGKIVETNWLENSISLWRVFWTSAS